MKTSSIISGGLATIAEAADFLKLGRSKIYLLCDAGELPWVKIGKARRIPRRALEQLAERNLVGRAS